MAAMFMDFAESTGFGGVGKCAAPLVLPRDVRMGVELPIEFLKMGSAMGCFGCSRDSASNQGPAPMIGVQISSLTRSTRNH